MEGDWYKELVYGVEMIISGETYHGGKDRAWH